MPTLTAFKPSFTGGEIAPALYARTDLQKYNTALKRCRNFIVQPFGGVMNRPGFEYVANTKNNGAVRLVPFQFNVEQSYLLEFGSGYVRFFVDGAPVYNGATLLEITSPYTADLDKLRYTQSADTLYITHPAHPPRKLVRSSHYSWAFAGFSYAPTISAPTITASGGSGTAFQICATSYSEDGETLPSSPVSAMAGGTVTITTVSGAKGYRVYRLVSGGTALLGSTTSATFVIPTDATGTAVSAPSSLADPFVGENILPVITATPQDGYTTSASSSWSNASMTPVTAFGATGWMCYPGSLVANTYWEILLPAATDVSALSMRSGLINGLAFPAPSSVVVHARVGGSWVQVASVTGFIASRLADSYIYFDQGVVCDGIRLSGMPLTVNQANYINWAICYLKLYGERQSPGVCGFFEQRLILARTGNQPQTLWGSRTADFENFGVSEPLQDDDSYQFTIASNQVNEIRGLVGLSDLIIFTAGAVWKAVGETAITPTNIQLRQQTGDGCAALDPLVVGEGVLYVQGSRAAVRDLAYSLESDGYKGNDITLLVPHLFTDKTLTAWAKQRYPFTVVWCVRSDGILLGLTYDRDQQVTAWHWHDTDGVFEDICSLNSTDGTDDVYAVVRREVNGSTRRFVEWLPPRLPQNDVELGFFVDCGLSLNNPASITAIGRANPLTITASGLTASVGDFVDIRGVTGTLEIQQDDEGKALPFKRYLVAAVSSDVYTLSDLDGNAVDASGWTAYKGGGTVRKAVTVISGLDHLEGKTVAILANGSEEPRQTVSSGQITLESPASIVHVGLPYISQAHTLELTADAGEGTLQDRKRDVLGLVAYLENTRALWIGADESSLIESVFRETENFDMPTELFTGTYDVAIAPGDGESASVLFQNDSPLPASVLAVIPRISYARYS